jgi:hypothetical protein
VKDEEKLMQMWKQEVKTHADETKTERAALQKRAEMLDEKETNFKACANYLSARHFSSQGTCELHLSRDSSSRAYSSRLCI